MTSFPLQGTGPHGQLHIWLWGLAGKLGADGASKKLHSPHLQLVTAPLQGVLEI
jgi:hypothetical protein